MDTTGERYIRRTDCVTREIAGETIIVPIRGNVGDLESIYTLDEIGAAIWRLIDGERDIRQVADAICEEYDVPAEQAEKDVSEFLTSLHKAGLIRPVEESAE